MRHSLDCKLEGSGHVLYRVNSHLPKTTELKRFTLQYHSRMSFRKRGKSQSVKDLNLDSKHPFRCECVKHICKLTGRKAEGGRFLDSLARHTSWFFEPQVQPEMLKIQGGE